MTRLEFGVVMNYLRTGTGCEYSADMLEVYFDCLGDLGSAAFQLAARRVLLSHPWHTFPSVAELRDAAVASGNGEIAGICPAKAWAVAWKVVAETDPEVHGSFERACQKHKAPPIVVQAMLDFGICDLCYGKEPIAIIRGQFLRTFEQVANAEHRAAIMPPKLLEAITGKPTSVTAPREPVSIGDLL